MNRIFSVSRLMAAALSVFAFVSQGFAADYYVRAGAAGANTGRDWTNAWRELDQISWGSILPGDTIWIAGGAYSRPLSVAKSGTSASRINIKRVRAGDAVPAAAAGWNSAFDAQVIINPAAGQGIRWASGTDQLGSYVTIDGRLDQGIVSYAKDAETGAAIYMDTGNTGVIVRFVDCVGPAGAAPYTFSTDCSALWINSNGRGNIVNPVFQQCRFHGTVNLAKIGRCVGITIEDSKFYDNNVVNYTTFHQNVVSSFLNTGLCTFRRNEVWNWPVEGIMLWSKGVSQSWEICNNLWHDSNRTYGNVGRVVEVQDTAHKVLFHNNTVVNVGTGYRTANGGAFASGSSARNNLFYAVGSITDTAGLSDIDNTLTNASTVIGVKSLAAAQDPFVDYAGKNYRIKPLTGDKLPMGKGVPLETRFALDLVGADRAASGRWDIGAYQAVLLSSGEGVPPSAAKTSIAVPQ